MRRSRGPKIRLPASSYEERCAARDKAREQETIADFKHRIALLMRNKEGGKQYSIIGAARPDPCVVRCNHTNKHWINKARGNFRCLDCGFQYFTKDLDNAKQDGILAV